ncbi:MAG TPA: c-di-GMP phosphodiesterase [Firmicutes bacterium]|jgi:HD-GYP domain-containing protein (c-di-GMP phosphodiesterase class II)|nr:c-di-GMP phosphodiesterase [Bacillota bacterium]
MKRQISVNLGNLLLSLSEITDLMSPLVSQHQQKTAFIAVEVAKVFGVSPEMLENIFTAALFHDIGAITVEEKIAIHKGGKVNLDVHCIKGEILLSQTPWFQKVAKIVRNHHRNWSDWEDTLANPLVLSSQIVLLADSVERLIRSDRYILHQNGSIIEQIKGIQDSVVAKELVGCFEEIAKREEFWLDLMSPRLYHVLLSQGPYHNVEIDMPGIALIATLFRDIIDFKSRFTATHTSGVSACTEILASLFGLTEVEINSLRVAGNLHDIGKLVIPNRILEKRGKLTRSETAIMKCHTYYTFYVINSIGGLRNIAEWAAYHHEKLDGSGYPFHCQAVEIDTGSRILAVADIFTALAEDRPYRHGMVKDEIYQVLQEEAIQKKIDSHIVELLFDNYAVVNEYVQEKQRTAKKFYTQRFLAVLAECGSQQ